jgi:hypothetical protein
VRQLQRDLAVMQAQNAQLGKNIALLEKCKQTLIFEEAALVNLAGIDSLALKFESQVQQRRRNFEKSLKRLGKRAIVAPVYDKEKVNA